MITRESLQEAITTCLRDKNPNANTCIKLAAYYTILDHIEKETPQDKSFLNDGQDDSEFARLIRERSVSDIMPVITVLMEELQIVNPRLYESVIRKIKGRG